MTKALPILLAILPGVCLGEDRPEPKKVIEWGWDESDTAFIRQNVQRMEKLPFDGLVFHVASSKGGNLTWEMWGPRRFEVAEFGHAIEDLRSTSFHRLTDRFLRVNVTPGSVDWFDDQAWSAVLNNFRLASQIAKDGGSKGFMFDVEQYNDRPFDYSKQKHRATKTFGEYQARVRRCGREWMKAVNGSFPDITILLTFGYSITGASQKDRSAATYGLLADFLDGMLDACSPQTKLVDAWEGAYTYKEKGQFRMALWQRKILYRKDNGGDTVGVTQVVADSIARLIAREGAYVCDGLRANGHALFARGSSGPRERMGAISLGR